MQSVAEDAEEIETVHRSFQLFKWEKFRSELYPVLPILVDFLA
jgi:hypothetical protein